MTEQAALSRKTIRIDTEDVPITDPFLVQVAIGDAVTDIRLLPDGGVSVSFATLLYDGLSRNPTEARTSARLRLPPFVIAMIEEYLRRARIEAAQLKQQAN